MDLQLKQKHILITGGSKGIGFACAVGIDMGFNTKHHNEEETANPAHLHSDGNKHHHHHEAKKHNHDEKRSNGKDDCCNDRVLKLLKTDKALPQFAKIISPTLFAVFIPVYYITNICFLSQVKSSNKYYVRGYHPPIPDILISIQKFQV